MRAYLTMQHGQQSLGTLYIDLFDDTVPKTVHNFVTLLREPAVGKGYRNCAFHRIIRGFMAQGGDFTKGDGTGGRSIYNNSDGSGMFPDENFKQSHGRAGVVAMANSGPHTNGSQFYITFKATPHLNGKHVVFGQVDLRQSADVLEALEQVPTHSKTNRPLQAVTIIDCGVVEEASTVEAETAATTLASQSTASNPTLRESIDEDEIDIDEVDESDPASSARTDPTNDPANDDEIPASAAPTSKAEAMKLRLRKLKQKMNQARQLNKQAVQAEGERIADPEKERRRLAAASKRAMASDWEATHARAMQMATETGVDAKALTEQGADSVRVARAKAEKVKLNRFQINDYHNSDSQHRNYERNLKSVLTGSQAASTSSTSATASIDEYNPLDSMVASNAAGQEQHSREGARRVASELHRRIEKRQERERKRKQKELHSGAADEASGINVRNKRFNEKINRTYDKQTAEIRQNLERGTAL